ncbi:hypothetical protein DFH28DRAFT_1132057 [Melampsora americana]|nr:hypothetical protein DFH28DRAFT_1132057 [Melampsora americana]
MNPEWLKTKKVALAPTLKKCKYFFRLEPVFGTQHANVRLDAAHGLPASIEEAGSYEENHTGSECNPMDVSVTTNYLDDDIDSGSPTMDDFRNVLNKNIKHCEDGQAPYTPTPLSS